MKSTKPAGRSLLTTVIHCSARPVARKQSSLGRLRGAARVQEQLLNTPIVHICDVQEVFRGARQPVDPVELAQLVARLPEHAHEPAIERELVNAAGLLI